MASQRQTPTLNDVAEMAGVSTATVSRCLNSPEQVIETTRARVLEAVQALGYSPNFGARVMAARRTNTIGAIIPTMENAIFARGLQAFQEELRRKGYTLLVASTSYRPEIEEQQIRSLVARGADGLLLIGHDRSEEIHKFLKKQGIPALVAWAHDPEATLPSVGFDNLEAMRALADHVLKLGHRRIGVITADTEQNDRARLRVQAIKDAVAAAGLGEDALTIVETVYGFDAGATAFEDLMATPTPPTVVMCGNDVLGVGAVRRALALGMRVPGDVSITGFDDIEISNIVTPELATVHVPHRSMGQQAATALVAMVEGKTCALPEALPSSLQIRASLGEPPLQAPAQP